MADSYLIDGYNLIHALGLIERQLGTKALAYSRRRLLEFLKESLEDEAPSVTIVFDAQHAPRHVAREQSLFGMRILFATDAQSADDLIEILIDANQTPATLVVISNDHRLQQAAHHHGARAWSHTDLLDFIDKRRSASREKTAPDADEKEPSSSADREHWINEFKSLESDPELREFFDLDRFEDL
jgi:predicted RNA-binding protein with PIN domain